MIKIKSKKFYGFTLIEAMVMLFIFSLITLTFYSVFSLGTRYIQDAKNRLGAIALANEKMEIIRNLPYASVGTATGIPSGDILADEEVSENTKTFHVKTFIQFIDDPFDGVSPTDTVPNDYKRVKITVSWAGAISSGNVSLVSRFVPQGMEVGSGDGTLAINAIDGQGDGVAQATVHIVNNNVSPHVDITTQTDSTGNIMFPGAKQSVQGYTLTVSKNNYETVETVDPDEMLYIPVDTNASVIQGLLNIKSIVINLLADIKIKSVDYLDAPIPSMTFELRGGRILGTNTLYIPAVTVYNLDIASSTGANGEKNLDDKSPGQYFLSNIGSIAGYSMVGSDGALSFDPSSGTYTVPVLADESKTVKIKFADNTKNSLLIKVKKEDETPISGAEVNVKNNSGYEVTQTSGVEGFVFFPNTSDTFSPGNYDIETKASGFRDANDTVSADKLTTKEIKLVAI